MYLALSPVFLGGSLVYLCIFWLFRAFVAARGLLVVASGGSSLLQSMGFSLRCLLSLQSTGPRTCRLQQVPRESLVVPRHVGSSRTRDQICFPCVGRRILIHRNIKEVLRLLLKQHCDSYSYPCAVTSIPRLRYKCRGRDHNPSLPALLCVFHFRLAVFLDVKHTSDLQVVCVVG